MNRAYLINKGQYLSEVLPLIPSNVILSKKLTGIGATTAEILAQRHSIIIVPNKPVIDSKCAKHKNLIGVFEGVCAEEIIGRMIGSEGYYKIMTTPESYIKVKQACEILQIPIYETFFNLCDEAHLYIDDADYRESIIRIMDDFFKFKNKALVSATPLEFSDPRFKTQSFDILHIEPTYKFHHDITAIHTNSIYMELKRMIENSNEHICVFINSVDMAYSMIRQLGIADNSVIFCSKKRMMKIGNECKFKEAYSIWSVDKMKQMNFFTSRFYNAFDMELPYKPKVIMITDVFAAQYTMLDIDTDCVQIIGRFRTGTSSVTHIFNTNPDIIYKTRQHIEWEISAHRHCYETIKTHYDNVTTPEMRYGFGEALKSLPFNQYVTEYGAVNYFHIDNEIHKCLVRNDYKEAEFIKFHYLSNAMFNLKYEEHIYPKGIDTLVIRHSRHGIRDNRKKCAMILSNLKQPYTEMDYKIITEIRAFDPLIVEAFQLLGEDGIVKLNYSEKRLKEAVILSKRHGTEAIMLIKNSFKAGQRYSNDFIMKELSRIFNLLSIHPTKKIRPNMIQRYFQAKPCKVKKERGYYLDKELL